MDYEMRLAGRQNAANPAESARLLRSQPIARNQLFVRAGVRLLACVSFS
jgi:hypothetical protein